MAIIGATALFWKNEIPAGERRPGFLGGCLEVLIGAIELFVREGLLDLLCEHDQLFHLFFGVGVVAVTGKDLADFWDQLAYAFIGLAVLDLGL